MAVLFVLTVVAANLLVNYFGPSATPIVAFLAIGLDLTLRDSLHEKWHKNGLKVKMMLLVCVSGVITYIINKDAGMVGVASTVAFSAALAVDAIIYQLMYEHSWNVKTNLSNIGSALVDSIIFPTLAFDKLMLGIIALQFLAKVVGGAVWSIILRHKER